MQTSSPVSILVATETRLLVQGLGKTGRFHADRSIAYGTEVVGAVHPSRAGETEMFEGETDRVGGSRSARPLSGSSFQSSDSGRSDGRDRSQCLCCLRSASGRAADAIMEAAAAGMPLIVAITEGVPVAT